MDYHFLTDRLWFPPAHQADAEGLLAVGGDLSVERLLLAYRSGIFPWYSDGQPVLWWSPDPRFVLIPQEFHLPRRLARTIRQGRFEVRADTAFEEVVALCSEVPRPGQDGTWITEEMIGAYSRLHHAGWAHSVECWLDGELAGGIYGVAVGKGFFGESMFWLEPDASKVALAALVQKIRRWGFLFLDCQMRTGNTARFGGRDVTRAEFLRMVSRAAAEPGRNGPWTKEFERWTFDG